ncbi:hypothetical protein AMR42_14300 [Limnothrix sp. PR1529]|nr:hypothetical protein AMR42_14300 [Limnothrix sp. PR1529]
MGRTLDVRQDGSGSVLGGVHGSNLDRGVGIAGDTVQGVDQQVPCSADKPSQSGRLGGDGDGRNVNRQD